MNQTGGKTPSTPRLSEYAANALETIRKELRMFSIGDVQSTSNTTNGQQISPSHNTAHQNQVECDLNILIAHLMNSGYSEEQAIAYIKSNHSDALLEISKQQQVNQSKVIGKEQTNGLMQKVPSSVQPQQQSQQQPTQSLAPKLFRKPSIEREIPQYQRGSPALDSGVGMETAKRYQQSPVDSAKRYQSYSPSPCPSALSDAPPLPLPRCSSTPSTPTNLQQLLKRISPGKQST